MELERFSYDNKIVKKFLVATTIFGIVGMLVGLLAATKAPRATRHFPELADRPSRGRIPALDLRWCAARPREPAPGGARSPCTNQ